MAGKVVRVVVLLVLLVVLGYVIWLKRFREAPIADTDDAATEQDIADRKEDLQRGGEAREAGEKLRAMKLFVAAKAPDPGSKLPPNYVSLACTARKLGDDGFALIGKCYTLESLTLTDTDVNDLRMKSLAGLKRLASLSIIRTGREKDAGTIDDGGLQCLASMPRLTGLNLTGTGVGDEGLKIVGRLDGLALLGLGGTPITDAGLGAISGLKNLQWLVLTDTAIGDSGVAALEGMSSLRQISLKGTKVTDKGRSALRKKYPRITID